MHKLFVFKVQSEQRCVTKRDRLHCLSEYDKSK